MDVNLVLLKKNGPHKSFPLPSSVTVIGRRHDCDLRVPLMSISKKHCQLYLAGGKLKIRDLGSRNGTKLNGKSVKQGTALSPGDTIKIGPVSFLLQIGGIPDNISQRKTKSQSGPKTAKSAEPPPLPDISTQPGESDMLDDFDLDDSSSLPDDFDLLEDDN